MELNSSSPYPEGVISFLDTDLYKLTMQCAVLKFFKDVTVTYGFTNRTKDKKLSREAFNWLSEQIRSKLDTRPHLLEGTVLLTDYRARARQYFAAR
jgi:hypothetical protein